MPSKPSSDVEMKLSGKEGVEAKDKPVCFYCKKCGHTINKCFALNKKDKFSKTVNLLKTETLPSEQTLPSQSVSVKSKKSGEWHCRI